MTRKIRINGIELVVDEQGAGNPRLFIGHHGAPGLSSHAEPKRAFGKLAEWLHVVTYDARGSGESDWVGPYTHEQWADDIDAVRQHFGAEKIIMAGGSYGGFMSLEYALRYPQHVEAIVLRDTAPRNYRDKAIENARARARDIPSITEDILQRVFDGQIRDADDYREVWTAIAPLYDVNYDPQRTTERASSTRFNHESNNYAFAVNLKGWDIRDRLPEIQVPVLITVGRHDWITPVEASEELHAGLPDSELVVFENSGHSPQVEEHDAWFEVVREFLDRRGFLS